jgi:short-subunit dehydrogenase involved in D-alanine esterification of teichoic acids
MTAIQPLEQLNAERFDAPAILKMLASSSRKLAELKGIAASFPNQDILINALGMQEAKDALNVS